MWRKRGEREKETESGTEREISHFCETLASGDREAGMGKQERKVRLGDSGEGFFSGVSPTVPIW